MDITFKTKKLAKELNSASNMEARHGKVRAKKLRLRLAELQAAECLADLGPPYQGPARCHELKGNRAGQLSVDLDHPYRLLFMPDHDPIPTRKEGGLDWTRVTRVKILGVEDTHD